MRQLVRDNKSKKININAFSEFLVGLRKRAYLLEGCGATVQREEVPGREETVGIKYVCIRQIPSVTIQIIVILHDSGI